MSSEGDSTVQLPPELLLLTIFGIATYIPGAFTHGDAPSFIAFAKDTHGISIHRRHREATDIMLAASRVCKVWAPVATEFLFKYLLVRSGDHAISIAAALSLPMNNSMNPRSIGRYTVRLELAHQGVHLWSTQHTLALARILSLCPNIRVFSNAFMSTECLGGSRSFLNALRVAGMRGKIRRLELTGNDIMLDAILRPLAPFLEELLVIPRNIKPELEVAKAIHFPALQTFVFSTLPSSGSLSWTMPTLHSFYIDCARYDDRRFFQIHGGQIRRLVSNSFIPSSACLKLCTNLVEWSFPCRFLRQAPAVLPPPTVRILTVLDLYAKDALAVNYIALLQGWLDNHLLPVLQTIRFCLPLARTGSHKYSGFDEEVAIRALQAACEQHGVGVEESLGGDEHTAGIWRPICLDFLYSHLGDGSIVQDVFPTSSPT